MPSRVIRGDINGSRSLSRVSLGADLTFRALLVAVDDYGRADGRLSMLRAALFPARPDVTEEALEGWLDELAEEGCIHRYEYDGDPFLCLPKWEKHRANAKRAKDSRFPAPTSDTSRESPRIPEEIRGDPPEGRGVRGRGAGGETDAPSALASKDTLSEAMVSKLVAMAPKGVTYEPAQVEAWFSYVAPKMRARGIKQLARAAPNWWSRVTHAEVQEAVEAQGIRRLEVVRREREQQPEPDTPDFDLPGGTLGRGG